jgi:hypothetical protein
MTPLPVPTSIMREYAISDLKCEISSSTSCSVSGLGTSARLSQRKLRPQNSTVPSRC